MTKKQIVVQEYKNILQKIYNQMEEEISTVDLFYYGQSIIKEYEDILKETCKTKRCARYMNEAEYIKATGTLGNSEALLLTAHQKLIFNNFPDDYFEDSKKTGSAELLELIGDYAYKMYRANPNNKYAQIIAHSFGYEVEELKVGEDYKALYSQFEKE